MLTPREFVALLKRYIDGQELLNYRTGLVCATLANLWRDSRTKPYTPQDFMPGHAPVHGRSQQTPEQMLEMVKILNAAFGGKVSEN